MYVNEKLKLNKFRYVAIPKPSEYFKRFGGMLPTGDSYTGEEVAVMPMSKVDMLGRAADYDMYQQYAEHLQSEQQEKSE